MCVFMCVFILINLNNIKSTITQWCPTLCDSMDTRLFCPWILPGKNTRVGCHFLLQGDLPNPGIEPGSPALQADSLLSEPPGRPEGYIGGSYTAIAIFL